MGVWLQAGKEALQYFFIIVKPWGVSDLPYIFAELGIELLAKKKWIFLRIIGIPQLIASLQ